jgi:hypothetical protein
MKILKDIAFKLAHISSGSTFANWKSTGEEHMTTIYTASRDRRAIEASGLKGQLVFSPVIVRR